MGKQYNTELQAKVETYMKETGISQAKLAPMMNLSGAVLSQYRRSVYDKGDVGDVERKIREFFQIKEEQAENAKKTESFNAVRCERQIAKCIKWQKNLEELKAEKEIEIESFNKRTKVLTEGLNALSEDEREHFFKTYKYSATTPKEQKE